MVHAQERGGEGSGRSQSQSRIEGGGAALEEHMKDRDMRSSMGNVFRWIAPLKRDSPAFVCSYTGKSSESENKAYHRRSASRHSCAHCVFTGARHATRR